MRCTPTIEMMLEYATISVNTNFVGKTWSFNRFFCSRKKADFRNDVDKEPKDLSNRTMFPSAQIKMR